MRGTVRIIAPVALALLALPVLAGGPECDKHAAMAAADQHEKHCTMSAAECKAAMAAYKKSGWLGVELDENESGRLVITKVIPGSPAQQAGFQKGDVFVSLNGVPFGKEGGEKFAEIRKSLKPGDAATYVVARGGEEARLQATLGQMPDAIYDAMVAEHMKEHTDIAQR